VIAAAMHGRPPHLDGSLRVGKKQIKLAMPRRFSVTWATRWRRPPFGHTNNALSCWIGLC